MSVQNKPDYKIFADGAKPGEVVTFPDVLRGWGVTLDTTGGIPPMEFANAVAKRLNEWLMYLTQRGIPEWDASVDYPKSAMVQTGDVFYVSIKENKNESPTTSQQSWKKFSDFFGIDGKLAKDQNGADIPNKDTFIENLGLPEKYQPKGSYQPAGNYADGNTFKRNIDNSSVISPAGKYSIIIDDNGKFFTWDGNNATVSFSAAGVMEVGHVPYARVTGAPAHLGVGQSWNNMTASRSAGVTYTNETGKPIQLCVYYSVAGAGEWGASLIVNGIETGGSTGGFSCIIPAGTVYRLDLSGAATLSRWLEMR